MTSRLGCALHLPEAPSGRILTGVCALPAACPALGEPTITVPTAAVIAANLQTCFPVGLPVVVWTDMDTFRAQSEG